MESGTLPSASYCLLRQPGGVEGSALRGEGAIPDDLAVAHFKGEGNLTVHRNIAAPAVTTQRNYNYDLVARVDELLRIEDQILPRLDELVVPLPQPFPSVAPLLMGILGRPAGSPLRRRVITDALRAGMVLMNCGEADRALRFYDPACEIHISQGFSLDAEPVYHGHAGWLAAIRLWEQIATLDMRHDGWDAAPTELAAALQRLTPATAKPSSTRA